MPHLPPTDRAIQPRPVPTFSERIGPPLGQLDRLEATATDTAQALDRLRADHKEVVQQLTAERDQARAEAAQWQATYGEDALRGTQAQLAELDRLRRVVSHQAAQIQRDGSTLVALVDWLEQGAGIMAAHDLADDGRPATLGPPVPITEDEHDALTHAATMRQIRADAAMGDAPVPAARAPEPAFTPDESARLCAQLIEARDDLETLRAERDALRDELGRALERGQAEQEVIRAAIAVRNCHPTDVSHWPATPIRVLIDAVDRLPQPVGVPATISAERPADPSEGDRVGETAETISAGRDPEPRTADEGDEWDALDRAFAPVLAQACAAMTEQPAAQASPAYAAQQSAQIREGRHDEQCTDPCAACGCWCHTQEQDHCEHGVSLDEECRPCLVDTYGPNDIRAEAAEQSREG